MWVCYLGLVCIPRNNGPLPLGTFTDCIYLTARSLQLEQINIAIHSAVIGNNTDEILCMIVITQTPVFVIYLPQCHTCWCSLYHVDEAVLNGRLPPISNILEALIFILYIIHAVELQNLRVPFEFGSWAWLSGLIGATGPLHTEEFTEWELWCSTIDNTCWSSIPQISCES